MILDQGASVSWYIDQIVLVAADGVDRIGVIRQTVFQRLSQVDEQSQKILVVGEGAFGLCFDEFCVVGEAAGEFAFLIMGKGHLYRVEVHVTNPFKPPKDGHII